MVLDGLRKGVDPILTFVARGFDHLSPNTVTWTSLIFAITAGLIFFISDPETESGSRLLCLASLFVFLNGFTDAIDGKIAKMKKKETLKGDFLDHAVDRFSDVAMILGLSLSRWCDPRIGIFAISGVLLTSYMGTQAQAVGYRRIYSGLLSRADRLVLLMVSPILQHVFIDFNINNFNMLEIVLIYFAIVGFATAAQRFVITLNWFRRGE